MIFANPARGSSAASLRTWLMHTVAIYNVGESKYLVGSESLRVPCMLSA